MTQPIQENGEADRLDAEADRAAEAGDREEAERLRGLARRKREEESE